MDDANFHLGCDSAVRISPEDLTGPFGYLFEWADHPDYPQVKVGSCELAGRPHRVLRDVRRCHSPHRRHQAVRADLARGRPIEPAVHRLRVAHPRRLQSREPERIAGAPGPEHPRSSAASRSHVLTRNEGLKPASGAVTVRAATAASGYPRSGPVMRVKAWWNSSVAGSMSCARPPARQPIDAADRAAITTTTSSVGSAGARSRSRSLRLRLGLSGSPRCTDTLMSTTRWRSSETAENVWVPRLGSAALRDGPSASGARQAITLLSAVNLARPAHCEDGWSFVLTISED
ncbi:hypothetical protein FB558_6366 [Pseudonocardia kunmingensis]|uniref:Uncharacterized protein n=1 Tax=Pseudonocardia kunmingensis TaxID=630975 RepID=A0A543D9X0_9PSEU|nr:hypothetical protein FB558_6366 [Pseudonocardia kunmingensis]